MFLIRIRRIGHFLSLVIPEDGGAVAYLLYQVTNYGKQRSFFFFSVTDECSNNNGGCSQLCLLTPFGAKCSCSDGLNLAVDGKTCEGT